MYPFQILKFLPQVCILPVEDPVAAFGRQITEIFRLGEERLKEHKVPTQPKSV